MKLWEEAGENLFIKGLARWMKNGPAGCLLIKCQWAKTLKSYQIESWASAVTKEDFPGLLSEL